MIPEKGKTYKIDYWCQGETEEIEETFYKGEAIYTGETDSSDEGEILYEFRIPNNILTALFAEEDIIGEIK